MGHPISEQSTSPILTRKERCEIDLSIGWSYSLAAEHGLYETLALSSALQEKKKKKQDLVINEVTKVLKFKVFSVWHIVNTP